MPGNIASFLARFPKDLEMYANVAHCPPDFCACTIEFLSAVPYTLLACFLVALQV